MYGTLYFLYIYWMMTLRWLKRNFDYLLTCRHIRVQYIYFNQVLISPSLT